MRNKGYRGRPIYVSVTDARTINYNNVTNVTNVTNVNVSKTSFHSGGIPWKHKKRHGKGGGYGNRRNRTPKLLRFCASGGFLDYGKASRMGRGEMCREASNVVHHSVSGLSSCAGRIASNARRSARTIASGIRDIVGAFFS